MATNQSAMSPLGLERQPGRRNWAPHSIAAIYAGMLALLVTFALPGGYFYHNYKLLDGKFESEARMSSHLLSQLISENPTMWTYQSERLSSSLSRFSPEGGAGRRVVVDLSRQEVISLEASTAKLAAPLLQREAAIYDSGRKVGTIVVQHSILGLLLSTVVLFVFTGGIAGGLCLIVARGPLQDLQKSWENTVFLASHDALTTLPNRRTFLERLERQVQDAGNSHDRFAVFYLDLDDFKGTNDSLGHAAGDRLLRLVALRLLRHLRGDDFVARLSGDEFVILQTHVEHPNNATALAERIERAMSDGFDLGEETVFVHASMGIAIYGQHGNSAKELRRHADLALYQAKLRPGTCWVLSTSVSLAVQPQRRPLDADLHGALERGEMHLHYQPQVDLATGQIQGVEALLRWNHPDRGQIQPADFVPLAEETGLIRSIGGWVIGTACQQAREWSHLTMAVNVSALQFQQDDLAAEVRGHLERTGLPSHRLQLEMTESVLLHDTEATSSTLQQLKAMGVGIIIDDFGTGYSSLSYLHHFSMDKLKIDHTFIGDLGRSQEASKIVQAIIGLGHALGMKINAEGIELTQQAHYLSELGCDEGQGFLYSRALPPHEIQELLNQQAVNGLVGMNGNAEADGLVRSLDPQVIES